MDPYKNNMIPKDIYHSKLTVSGQVSAIMNAHLDNRQLNVIDEPTRVFRKYEHIEIIATKEHVKPGAKINKVAYIAFVEVKSGGLIRVGDELYINNKFIGHVLGFDATHTPN